MLHKIPIAEIGPNGPAMAQAVTACVHCGFCLPACPTYLTLGEEMDSPRGRIILMKGALEGTMPVAAAAAYLDRCLGCLGCVTACPSGVEYGDLLTPFRAWAESRRRRPLSERVVRRLMLATLPYPGRFRLAALLGRAARPVRRLLPRRLRAALDLLPASLPRRRRLPEQVPARGPRRARVALLAGCAQQVLAPEINEATIEVLSRNGVEVVIPPTQQCCGALSAHTGEMGQAARLARHNLAAFPADVDAIVTNAAGCGSGMKEYAQWLRGEPEEETARSFVHRVCDVSEFLSRLGPLPPGPLPQPMVVAYHDACHLAHAQGITAEPRQLLCAIPNLELVEIPEGELCCGSAGTYNLEQPAIAADLGRRKAAAILTTPAEAVATGNIGCSTQIAAHLACLGRPLPVYHTMQLLALAYADREE